MPICNNQRGTLYWAYKNLWCSKRIYPRPKFLQGLYFCVSWCNLQKAWHYIIYADDNQPYLAFNPEQLPSAVHNVQSCLDEIHQWMAMNWLKRNNYKTERIIFGSRKNLNRIDISSVRFGDSDIEVSDCVKSIGTIFDSTLSMEAQILATCRSAWHHLHMMGKIRMYLTKEQNTSTQLVYMHKDFWTPFHIIFYTILKLGAQAPFWYT